MCAFAHMHEFACNLYSLHLGQNGAVCMHANVCMRLTNITRMILLLNNANFGHLISACIVIVVLLSYLKS